MESFAESKKNTIKIKDINSLTYNENKPMALRQKDNKRPGFDSRSNQRGFPAKVLE